MACSCTVAAAPGGAPPHAAEQSGPAIRQVSETAPREAPGGRERPGTKPQSDGILVAGLKVAVGEAGEALCHFVDHGDDADLARLRRDDLPVGEVATHTDGLAGEVDVAPAQREELAASQAGERGGENDGGVLVV